MPSPPKTQTPGQGTPRHIRNTQRPSPDSANMRLGILSPSPFLHPFSSPGSSASSPTMWDQDAQGSIFPLKSFVHDVFHRSCSSSVVLKTALYYSEAIRQKVPELVKKEKAGGGTSGEDGEERLTVSDNLDLQVDASASQVPTDTTARTEIYQTPPVDFDRTIQMSSFINVPTPPHGCFAPCKQMRKLKLAIFLQPHINISREFSEWERLPNSAHCGGVPLPFTDVITSTTRFAHTR